MSAEFLFDVFLGHSSKDKAVVRDIAKRLREAGLRLWFDEWVLKLGDSLSSGERVRVRASQIEEGLEHSRVLACPAKVPQRRRMLCMSVHAFGSDWAQLAGRAKASLRRQKSETCGRGN